MAGKPGMHKKTQVNKDETLMVASLMNGKVIGVQSGSPIPGSGGDKFVFSADPDLTDAEQEEKFLKEMMEGYSYWRKQPGDRAKAYAAAYKTLLNEFTAEETKE